MILDEADITSVGKFTEESYGEGYLITFINTGPEDFKDYCLCLEVKSSNAKNIKKGNVIYFDNEAAAITAVGSKALENLKELGHVTIKFSGSNEAENPGDIVVTKIDKFINVKDLKKFKIEDSF